MTASALAKHDSDTAMHCLDRAVHPGTNDQEALQSIRAFRRLTNGATATYLCEQLFGEAMDLLVLEDEWEQKFAEQDDQIKRLKAENHQLRRGITVEPASTTKPPKTARTQIVIKHNLTDSEWAVVLTILPMRYRTDEFRRRVAAFRWVLNGEGTWRDLTPGSASRWTTFYNMQRALERTGLWQQIVAALALVRQ